MRIGSLFSGIGGLELGLERAGVGRTVWQCEIAPYARAVLAKHWPDAIRFDDITKMHDVPPVDLICGGFPCQDISNAGKRVGIDGARSDLFFELMRVVRLVRPRFVVLENVAALLGRGMGDVLGELSESGYDAEWDCVPASAVGAPHRRDRVFIIGVLADAAFVQCDGGEHHSERDSQRRQTAFESGNRSRSENVANAMLNRRGIWTDEQELRIECGGASVTGFSGEMAYSDEPRLQGRNGEGVRERSSERSIGARRASVSDPDEGGLARRSIDYSGRRESGWTQCVGRWEPEPDVGRVAHGVPSRVDRLRCLGNAVVPQVAEVVGRRVMQIYEKGEA